MEKDDLLMTASKPPVADKNDPIMATPEAVAEVAMRAFSRGKDEAIAENERLSVPSFGTGKGQPVARHRTKTKPTADLHHK